MLVYVSAQMILDAGRGWLCHGVGHLVSHPECLDVGGQKKAMQHTTDHLTARDGLKLHTEQWLPDDMPRAIILIAHGYGEHIGRYQHVAEVLVHAGYGVCGLDHRGHGKSEGLRAYLKTLDTPVDDLYQYFQQIREAHPNQKYFLLGHSMGTLISLLFLLKYQNHFAGAILSGTALNADETVSVPMRGVAGFLARIIPTVPLIPALGSETLSTDPAVAQAYDADPLVYRGSWRVGMGAVLLQTGGALRTRLAQLTLPLLIMHGSADAIAPLSGAQTLHDGAASEDATLHVYEDMLHEIFNERDKQQVFDDLLAWLNAH